MASTKQIELFARLSNERRFAPGTNPEQLRAQFANLSDRNASAWIERALELDKRTDEEEAASHVAPPF